MDTIRILFLLLLSITLHAQTSGIIGVIGANKTTTEPVPPIDDESGIHVSKTGNDANACDFANPCLTIQRGSNVANSGDTVFVHAGTYRETITPDENGIMFINFPGDEVFVSGVEDVGNSGWTVHSGNIYKKTITLPLNADYGTSQTTNTPGLANQVFKDGYLMIMARSSNLPGTSADVEQLMSMSSFNSTTNATVNTGSQLTDPQNPTQNVAGGQVILAGWFIFNCGTISSSSGTTLNYSGVNGNIKFRERSYVTGDLDLLDSQNEWHYEGGILYAYQIGGGSPTGLTYKARNYGFDLSNRSSIVIKGINFFACEPAMGNTSTTNCTIDGEDSDGEMGSTAYYTSHAYFIPNEDYNNGMSQYTGIRMLGSGNTVKNMDFKYASGTSIWAGQGMVIDNNRFQYIGYQGDYSAPVRFSGNVSDVQVTRNIFYYINRAGVNFNRGGGETHYNLYIALNEFGFFSQLTNDVGSIYGSQGCRIDGTRITRNWSHDNVQPNHEGFGVQVGFYYADQHVGGTGTTVDHNIVWNGSVANLFHERDVAVPATNFYNNTTWITTYGAYVSHVPLSPPYDKIRNQYSYNSDVFCSGACGNDKANSLNGGSPLFVGGDLNTIKGLYFQLQAGSPLIDAGVSIPGITGSVTGSAPDLGAMERNVSPFLPGPTWD